MRVREELKSALLGSALFIEGLALPAAPALGAPATVESLGDESAFAYALGVRTVDGSEVDLDDLRSLAAHLGSTLRAVSYSGNSGSGEIAVASDETSETLEHHAQELFEQSHTTVPPVAGGSVESDAPIADEEFSIGEFEVTVTSKASADDRSAPPGRNPARDTSPATAVASNGELQPQLAAVNDWPRYFPFDWRAEGYNGSRCLDYSNGQCHNSIQVARLTQQIQWTGDHNPAAWPSRDWGLEFGLVLYNYNRCPNENTVNYGEQWWLNGTYTQVNGYMDWSIGFPGSADAYLDDNRMFDACSNLSHELGVRYPGNLVAGATYSFTVSAPRNAARPSSTFSAAFQAVHDDCIGDWGNLTDCMGLWNVAWPYSGAQSAIVVNVDRHWTQPNCVRMHDQWTNPVIFANGTSRLMPAPLSYYDTCFYNDSY